MMNFHLQFDCNRQPSQQHVRVQGVQEQDANFSGQTSLRSKASLPGTHGYEHRAKNDGLLKKARCCNKMMFPCDKRNSPSSVNHGNEIYGICMLCL